MTDFDDDPVLRERLRAADPVASLAPADPDRVARLLEATMSETPTRHEPAPARGRRSNPLTWLVAAAAVLVIGGVTVFAVVGGNEDTEVVPAAGESPTVGEPAVTVLAAPAATDGRCMVPSAEVLRSQAVAFLGTAETVTDEVVTLDVEELYAGERADEVQVQAPPEGALLPLEGGLEFREGEQYLVSASEGRVTVCGLSGPVTPDLRALYDEAFGG